MANSANTDWDENSPSNAETVLYGASEIRNLRAGVRIRLEKEHTVLDDDSVGGEHRAGSAIIYLAADADAKAAITTCPDEVTTLSSADNGRLLYQEDTQQLFYWKDTEWIEIHPYGFGDSTRLDSDGDALVKETVYQVTSDGFISVENNGAGYAIDIKMGATSNPPTRYSLGAWGGNGGCFPIKKDEYFKISTTASLTYISWQPFVVAGDDGVCEK